MWFRKFPPIWPPNNCQFSLVTILSAQYKVKFLGWTGHVMTTALVVSDTVREGTGTKVKPVTTPVVSISAAGVESSSPETRETESPATVTASFAMVPTLLQSGSLAHTSINNLPLVGS